MKMVKSISALMLFTVAAILLYSASNTKKACEVAFLNHQELKGRLYDIKTMITALSEKVDIMENQSRKA